MISISKLFLINETGPILGPPFGNSSGSRFGGNHAVLMNKPAPRPVVTGGEKIAKIDAALENMPEKTPKQPVPLGIKPFKILT